MIGETDLILVRSGKVRGRDYLGKAFSKEIILALRYES